MDAQADLCFCWSHMSAGTFSHVEDHFVWSNSFKSDLMLIAMLNKKSKLHTAKL